MKANTHNVTFKAGTATVLTPVRGISATYKVNGKPASKSEYFKALKGNGKSV